MQSYVHEIIIYAVPILLGLTVHEYAHGWAADRLGDPTPREMGRLTLNPLAHLDIIGTAVFFVTRTFGWAKPVAIDPGNLAAPRRDMMRIAAAGPLANFLLALACALLFHLLRGFMAPGEVGPRQVQILFPLLKMLMAGVSANLALGLINLIPIPPLDGSRILAGMLPEKPATLLARVDSYGAIILVILVFSNSLNFFFFPLLTSLTEFLLTGYVF
jgi:Zn-dependent protease